MFDFIGKLFGGSGDEKTTTQQNTITQLPNYAESDAARGKWWDTLQEWGGQPGYGAIGPNWDDIWANASNKVQRYFQGGPEGPGVVAKVKARQAARNMSEQPGADSELMQTGFQQGNMLQDLAIQQAISEAEVGEKGRTNWLSSLMSLAGLKPSFMNTGSTSTTQMMPGVTPISSEGLQGLGGGGIQEMLMPLLQMFGGGGSVNIGNVGGGQAQDKGDDWGQVATAAIPALLSMFCWVAAELFDGMHGPKTAACRNYIGNIGPKWFKRIYIKHGKRFAKFIKNKPILKAAIKPLFEYFAWRGGWSYDYRLEATSV